MAVVINKENLELIQLDKLVPYARNARVHSESQIKQIQASIREFGFVNPILIDKDLNIIAGHGRVEAARHEGILEVPCVFLEHLTETQKKAYIIADNKLALNSGWDNEILKLEMDELKEFNFNIELTGFNLEDFKEKVVEEEEEQDELIEEDKETCQCPECGCRFEVKMVKK